jgi:diguanylate cyclase (GGDEF)-like protein
MWLRRQPESSRRWRLRTVLALPVMLVALVVAASQSFIELSVRAQVESLVAQRGTSVLAGITRERRQSKQIYAQLLADQSAVLRSAADGDKIGLAQILGPQMAKLQIGRVAVHAVDGRELLRLGTADDPVNTTPLVASALAGIVQSTAAIEDGGLAILAAAPLKGPEGIIGVLLVGTTLGADDLAQIYAQDGVQLALFRGGRLTATTMQPDLAQLLTGAPEGSEQLQQLNSALASHHFQSVATPLGGQGLLLVLVATNDLDVASQQRTLLMVISTGALGLVLAGVGLVLARRIAGPLENMAAATTQMVQGDYGLRVMSSPILELNDLGQAVNNLADQVQARLAQLTHQAFHDVLSNLPNRALFLDRLELTLKDTADESVAVLFLDLDNFKFVNDSLGHQAGDSFLLAVSQRLEACVRPGDMIARLGGDEFTILLKDIAGVNDAIAVCERIAEQLEAPFIIAGREVFATASVGIALSTAGHTGSNDLLRDADVAMYSAKTNGKARYQVFDHTMGAQATERLEVETDLRRAVERGEFCVHYQPIVQLTTGRIVEMEALVRWEHPRRGLVLPALFIPLAEETGLIVPIGQWVLEEACRQARAWEQQFPAQRPLVINVNLSGRQLQQPDLIAVVTDALSKSGLAPSRLKLEITESVVMQDAEGTIATLWALKELGIQLAIDDFGTGYSSLSYLKRFPVDTLKIDRSFVDGLGCDSQDTAVVGAIMALAKAFNLTVTGEGIETFEQGEELRAQCCDLGQGFYFAKPQSSAAVSALLAAESHLDERLAA